MERGEAATHVAAEALETAEVLAEPAGPRPKSKSKSSDLLSPAPTVDPWLAAARQQNYIIYKHWLEERTVRVVPSWRPT